MLEKESEKILLKTPMRNYFEISITVSIIGYTTAIKNMVGTPLKDVIKMEPPIYLGFVNLELSKLIMYETYYDKLQKYFRQDGIQLHYQDTDSFVLGVKTKDIVKDLNKLQQQIIFFDLSNLNKFIKSYPLILRKHLVI